MNTASTLEPIDDPTVFERVYDIHLGATGRPLPDEMRTAGHADVFRSLLQRIQKAEVETKKAREALHRDPNTQLPTYERFIRRLAKVIADRRERVTGGSDPGCCTVVFCDINDFGKINKKVGHQNADKLIKAVADGLCEIAVEGKMEQPIDFVARSFRGGDEFMLFMNGISADDARERMETVAKKLAKKKFFLPGINKVVSNVSLAFGCYELGTKQPGTEYDNAEFRLLPPEDQERIRNKYHAKFAIDQADGRMHANKGMIKHDKKYHKPQIKKAKQAEIVSPKRHGLIELRDDHSTELHLT